MAIDKVTRYPGRWDTSSDYPMGQPKNRTSETSNDGTYFEKDWLSDYEAAFGNFMNEAELSPDGNVDTADSSQFAEAIKNTYQAQNLIKTSRLVVEGTTGDSLPTNGTNTNYAVDAEVALGCVAGTAIANLTNSLANDVGNWTADSGEIYYEVEMGPGKTISDYFGSIMQWDGSKLVQIYSDDDAALTLSEVTSGYARLTYSYDTDTTGFVAWCISEQRGKIPTINDNNVEYEARGGFLLIENSNGRAMIFKDGTVIATVRSLVSSGDTLTFPVELKRDSSSDIKIVANHVALTGVSASSFCVTVDSISTTQYQVRMFSLNGAGETGASANLSIIIHGELA